MGDRGNIVVLQEKNDPIYLYTHWTGSMLDTVLANALDRGRDRWGDTPYLARIIFSQMTQGRERENTGYGISTYPTDNDYGNDYLVVDDQAQTVGQVSSGAIGRIGILEGSGEVPYKDGPWPYEEFIEHVKGN